MAPDDEDLLKFVLDEIPLPEAAKEHLAQCPDCQQRLADYKGMNNFLISRLYRSQCPDSMQLSLYCANELPETTRIQISTHLRSCPLCTTEVADTRRFLAEPLPEPPIARYESGRRFVATLITPQRQLVLRGMEKVWPRQYQASTADLLLDLLYEDNKEYRLLGAVTPTDISNLEALEDARAELHPIASDAHNGHNAYNNHYNDATSIISTRLDDLGSFMFDSVPVGDYTLHVRLPDDCELVVEKLHIAPEDAG